MKKQELLEHIGATAKANSTNERDVANARVCISLLKIGDTKLVVWEADRVSVCSAVSWCDDPKKFDAKGITRVTKVGRGKYEIENIDRKSLEARKIYK